MPELKDLPPIARKEVEARRTGEHLDNGVAAQKKKVGFFERLAGVGRVSNASDSPKEGPEDAWAGEAQTTPTSSRGAQNEPHGHPVNKMERMSSNSSSRPANANAQKSSLSEKLGEGSEDVEFPDFLHR
ncbi:MAG: hypothetical protein ACR2OX_08775 [Methyloligellaceae bacterium]